jgi:hypothetical protein
MPFTLGPQTMSDECVASNVLDEFLEVAGPTSKDSHRLMLAAALLEMLRLAGSEAKAPIKAREQLVTAAGHLACCDFSKLPFSLTRAVRSETVKDIFDQVGLAPERRDSVLLEALRQFVNVMQFEPQAASQELFNQLAAEAAVVAVTPPSLPAAPPVKKAPPVVQNAHLQEVFAPAKFSPDGSPTTELLDWQSEYPSGKGLGPQLAALSLDEGTAVKILTETGEFVWVPKETFLLAKVTDAADYAATSPYMLACARVYAPWCWGPAADLEALYDARFGRFTKPVLFATYATEFVSALQDVFDRPGNYPPGNSVSVTLAVDGSPYSVTLDARTSNTGPYITAKLLDAQENIVMRLDTPRQFSPRGVYLFPLPEAAVGLIVF